MKNLYQDIVQAKSQNRKLLAILLDPDKVNPQDIEGISQKIMASPATHVLVGGSTVDGSIDTFVLELQSHIHLPILLFPGHPSQLSAHADGVLFLMLLSGRNPDFLIGFHVQSVPMIENSGLEVISTGYLLIESGAQTAVERVSQTPPLLRDNPDYAAQTAKAGELIGNQLIYLEAGSGATCPVPLEMVSTVSRKINIPLIVGGGIRSKEEIEKTFEAGADMVVIGTAFENDPNFFNL